MNIRATSILITLLLFLAISIPPVIAADSTDYNGFFPGEVSSGDGTLTVTSTGSSIITLFDNRNNLTAWSYNLHGTIGPVAISPDNKFIAAGSDGGLIWLFDQKGTVVWNKTFSNSRIKSIVFSEDSRFLDASNMMNQAFYLDLEGNRATRQVSPTVSEVPSVTPAATQAQIPVTPDLSGIESFFRTNQTLILVIITILCIAGIAGYLGSHQKYRKRGISGSVGDLITLRNFTIVSLILVATGGILRVYSPTNYGAISNTVIMIGIAGILITYYLYTVMFWGNDDKFPATLMLAIPLCLYYFSTTRITGSLNPVLDILIIIVTYAVISAILLFISDKIRTGISSAVWGKRARYYGISPDSSYILPGIVVVSLILVSMGSTVIVSENAGSVLKSMPYGNTGSQSGTFVPVQTLTTVAPLRDSATAAPVSTTQAAPVFTPTPTPAINYETGLTSRSFTYVLRGNAAPAYADMYSGVYTQMSSKSAPVYCARYNYDPSPCTNEEKRQYLLNYLDDPDQKKSLDTLVRSIESKTSNKDDQARIAISLVQQIPYDYATFSRLSSSTTASGERMRYPYEVLYKNTGVCSEKSLVLAYLLRELGYGVVLFEFPVENHMAVGIKSPAQYAYKNSGYAFVETAAPTIPTDDQGNYVGVGKLTNTPDIFSVSDGRSFDTISEEYQDAQRYHTLLNQGRVLDEYSYSQWTVLVRKYGLKTSNS